MTTNDAVIATIDLTKRFGALAAVNKVSYTLRRNEIAAIIGPNGAGKTTLFNLITGAYAPDEGAVLCDGIDITRYPPQRRVLLGIKRTFQLASTFDSLRVIDNLRLAYFRARKASSIPYMVSSRMSSLNDRALGDYLERFGLASLADVETRNVSLGNKRKLEIAMALISEPRVLLLDEPFAGLSETEIAETIGVLREYVHRIAILIVEHKITKLKDLAERITVLAGGEIIADGEYREVLESPQVRRSYWQVG